MVTLQKKNDDNIVIQINTDDFTYYWVTFIAKQSYSMTKVELPLAVQGTPGNMEVYIYSTDANNHADTQLAQYTDIAPGTLSSVFIWAESTGTAINIIKGTAYSIVVKPLTQTGADRYKFAGNNDQKEFTGTSNDLITFANYAPELRTLGYRTYGTLITDTTGEQELKTNYPVTSGLGFVNKHQGRQSNLVPLGLSGRKSNVLERKEDGIR